MHQKFPEGLTVRELIELLKDCDQSARIQVTDRNGPREDHIEISSDDGSYSGPGPIISIS